MDITVKEIAFNSQEYCQAVKLREKLLREPLGMKFTPEFLAGDSEDYHIAAFDLQNKLVGCLQLKPLAWKSEIKMRQAAVDSHMQGKGVGAKLLAFAEDFSRTMRFGKMVLHARKHVIDFYIKSGYSVVSKEFTEVGIPHKKMEKLL
jgi:predicted GNAT family N-acyltransferase